MKKSFYYFFVVAVLLGMFACSQDEVEIFHESDVSKIETKALNGEDSLSVIIPLVIDSNLIEGLKQKRQLSIIMRMILIIPPICMQSEKCQ